MEEKSKQKYSDKPRLIVGLTGAFGSGTSYIAKKFFKEKGYVKLSLADSLKEEYNKHLKDSGKEIPEDISRKDLQDYGNFLRADDREFLAKNVNELIQNDTNYVIDSFRNPAEIEFFRSKHTDFILIGVFATRSIRWDRKSPKYEGNQKIFNQDDERDSGKGEPPWGQRISDCFFESDLVISNNEDLEEDIELFEKKEGTISHYLEAFRRPDISSPRIDERFMADAYIAGRESTCMKRRVGAVIVNKQDRIVSSGCNTVPNGRVPCDTKFRECFRDRKRREFAKKLSVSIKNNLKEGGYDDSKFEVPDEIFKHSFINTIKLIDYCRSLHGEESAIMSLVGSGVSLEDSTIYVTTHPCNLCANKIVQSGIKHVVYFEPYPIVEAQNILKEGGVDTRPFEGVTFRAFFKAYKYQPS